MDPDLDTHWIEEFEKIDSNYQSFYTEKIKNIRFNYVYISKDNVIEKIKEETILLENENIKAYSVSKECPNFENLLVKSSFFYIKKN